MADISTIEQAIVAQIANTLFNMALATQTGSLIVTEGGFAIGLGGSAYQAGSYVTSTLGTIVKLYRGWPVSTELDADVVAGKAHVSVFPEQGMTRNVTRYEDYWSNGAFVPSTLTVATSSNVATFSGTCADGQVVAVLVGASPVTAAYPYAVLPTDTPATVAAALAALVPGATASGAVLTCSSVPTVRIGMAQTATMETRRQVQGFRVTLWCPSPAVRDALAGAVDSTLAQLRTFTLPTGEFCQMQYSSTLTDDVPSKARLWVRHLRYTIEYPTTFTQAQQQMTIGIANETLNGGGVVTLIE